MLVVCFETPGFARERAETMANIKGTWGAVARINFLGGHDCKHTIGAPDLRVRIADERPHVPGGKVGFGVKLRGVAGAVTLNYSLNDFGCVDYDGSSVLCRRYYDIHEFGHALGFLHEQDRPDAPLCPDGSDQRTGTSSAIGKNGGMTLNAYDAASIMNDCHYSFANPTLSAADIAGVRRVYGRRDGTPIGAHPASSKPTAPDAPAPKPPATPGAAAEPAPQAPAGEACVALVRSHAAGRGHWTSIGGAPAGFVEEQRVYLPADGARALYLCAVGEHAMPSLDPGCEGQYGLGFLGRLDDEPGDGAVAVYRCNVASGADHFFTQDPECEGQTPDNGGLPLGFAYASP